MSVVKRSIVNAKFACDSGSLVVSVGRLGRVSVILMRSLCSQLVWVTRTPNNKMADRRSGGIARNAANRQIGVTAGAASGPISPCTSLKADVSLIKSVKIEASVRKKRLQSIDCFLQSLFRKPRTGVTNSAPVRFGMPPLATLQNNCDYLFLR